MWKNGHCPSTFEHVFGDHTIVLQAWRCSNIDCSWTLSPSIKGCLSGKEHIDLQKLKVEFGANHSYRDATSALNRFMGKDRPSINRMNIQRATKKVGALLENIHDKKESESPDAVKPVEELYMVVDGGHVHDGEHKGKNFETMVAKVYHPDNVKRIDKHHTSITHKHCAASAKADEQSRMKRNVLQAAKKEGMNAGSTILTALADGAKNCWNIIDSLFPHCLAILCILDWFHIGKYILRVKQAIPVLDGILEDIKGKLWKGHVDDALRQISILLEQDQSAEHKKIIQNFHSYVDDNKDRIINYDERKRRALVYTSHVAESTVDHLLNKRAKKKQKMQWYRSGLHAVMQIRSSQASGEWESDWQEVVDLQTQLAA